MAAQQQGQMADLSGVWMVTAPSRLQMFLNDIAA